jgi:hypothetical protein
MSGDNNIDERDEGSNNVELQPSPFTHSHAPTVTNPSIYGFGKGNCAD